MTTASSNTNTTSSLCELGDVVGGRYRIEAVIGIGAMGVVFSARQLDLDRPVALKVLAINPRTVGSYGRGEDDEAKEESDGRAFRARFDREARVLSKLNSSNVCRLLDVGNLASGAPFIVMELLEGQDLSKLVKSRGPLPIAMTIDLALQACAALGEAHELGIVHRDVKPANMFLARTAGGRSELKLLDFGISKVRAPEIIATNPNETGGNRGDGNAKERSLTRAAELLGSPLYMSPEQLRATRDVDARTDVWSLGVVLYELLSGRPPFDGESVADVCASIMVSPTPSLTKLRPDIPTALAAIVSRCLEKDPGKRYASITDLADHLRCLPELRQLRDLTVPATAPPPPPITSMWHRLALTLTAATIAITGVTMWHSHSHAEVSNNNSAGYAEVLPPSPSSSSTRVLLLDQPPITDAPIPIDAQPLVHPTPARRPAANAAKTLTEPDLGY